MPDISMCPSEVCPKRETCYRNKASGTQASRPWQAYLTIDTQFNPPDCEHYEPVKRKGKTVHPTWHYNGEPRIDPIVAAVQADLLARSAVGLKKYGVGLDRDDLDHRAWLQHAYEELLDAACYFKAAMARLDRGEKV